MKKIFGFMVLHHFYGTMYKIRISKSCKTGKEMCFALIFLQKTLYITQYINTIILHEKITFIHLSLHKNRIFNI